MKLSVLAIVCLFGSGCMTAEVGEEAAVTRQSLVTGAVVTNHPEVGRLEDHNMPGNMCSATLIGRRTILTAAHCFHGQSDWDLGPKPWTFRFKNLELSREVVGYIGFGDGADPYTDFAVAALDRDVDPAVDGVLWDNVAVNFPVDPKEEVEWLGYGCSDFETDAQGVPWCFLTSNYDDLHRLFVRWEALADDHMIKSDESGFLTNLVGGDSGGPVLNGAYIILVASSRKFFVDPADGFPVRGQDQFANVVAQRQAILGAAERLGERLP